MRNNLNGITIKPFIQNSQDHSAGILWASINELAIGDSGISLRNYPHNYFDIIVVDKSHGGGIVDQAKWRDLLQHFKDIPQIAIAYSDSDRGYFTKYISADSQTQNFVNTLLYEHDNPDGNESHFVSNMPDLEYDKTTYNSFNYSIQTLNKTEQSHITINHNKIIINNTKMARQTSFSHQIELAERLKSYLHGFQERLGDVAQNYKNKCNDLFEAGMMEETFHDFEMNYMHETISKIADVITQVNENDIPFIERFIAYLEQNPSK